MFARLPEDGAADGAGGSALSAESSAGSATGGASRSRARRSSDEPDPHEFDAGVYLQRLIQYEVTHEVGFSAATSGCAQRITVDLYPLKSGWTVFARYSGHAREEKVDAVEVDEFPELAQRITRALLRDRSIRETITRENVLRSDSEGRLRTIGVKGHALFGLGTSIRAGTLPTSQGPQREPQDELRWLTPINLRLGYRGKFRAWGLDAFGQLSLGTREESLRDNAAGGHVDYAGGLGVGLHFLHYLDPEGVTSFYLGAGACFDLGLFTVIRAEDRREDRDHDLLVSGGLDLDLVVGYEFLRAASAHFFVQWELRAPTYLVRAESSSGSVDTYLPGAAAHLGVIF
jgi:hypothetical protein